MITVNLPTRQLAASVAFFTALGFQRVAAAPQPGQTETPIYLTWDAEGTFILGLYSVPGFTATVAAQPDGSPYKAIQDAQETVSGVTCLALAHAASVDRNCLEAARMGGRVDPLPPVARLAAPNRFVEDPDGRLWHLVHHPSVTSDRKKDKKADKLGTWANVLSIASSLQQMQNST